MCAPPEGRDLLSSLEFIRSPDGNERRVSATIHGFVSEEKQAKRYYVSGTVQGVGYRFFVQRVAENLRLSGYVRNLFDGRVEVFAIGTAAQLATLRKELKRGPRLSSVSEVWEELVDADPQYANGFVIDQSR